jgi:uncharacterized repeat protein (TIGR01451 family)
MSRRHPDRFRNLELEGLESRLLLAVTIASTNNSGQGYSVLDFNSSGGYVPPDTCGAVGPSNYVETVNQELAIYTPKTTGASVVRTSFNNFWYTVGGLTKTDSNSFLSDPIVAYDNLNGRFIVGDQDVDTGSALKSNFDIAVSKTSNPATLTSADWNFYQISTTEAGYSADYPGNFGFNADAFVFTLNMFGSAGHVLVTAVNTTDLANGVTQSQLHSAQYDLTGFSLRPTTMHDSVPGDPMWLVGEAGNNRSINVIKMSSPLANATFQTTNLAVNSYSTVLPPRNPNQSVITSNIDSRILKSAEANNTIVATHAVSASSTEDDIRWYSISVSGGTPVLKDQGNISAGNDTYLAYPSIDINSAGNIGMTYDRSGFDSSSDFMSMYVTGRVPGDPAGTMETPVLVPAGTGKANYSDFSPTGRQGDLSGINVDPSDGSFWAANEFANTESGANWGTAVANFTPAPSIFADLALSQSGPSLVNAGSSATYTMTLTNAGPNAAPNLVLSDTLPAGSTFLSMTKTSGSDSFTFAQVGNTITETSTSVPVGNSDTFALTVFAPASLSNGSVFSNTASVNSNAGDSTPADNTITIAGSIINSSGQTLSSIVVSPAAVSLFLGATQQFSAVALDQIGLPMANQPTITWSVVTGGSGGTITPSGLYTASSTNTGNDTVRATSGSVVGTATVTTSSGIPTQLVVTTQPSTTSVFSPFSLVVKAEDAGGRVAVAFSGTVTLALATGPAGATLGGVLTATASNGVATFSGLNLNKVATGYILKATSGSLTAATSSGINVIAAPATQLVITTQPPASVTAGSGFGLTVMAEDSFGNVDLTYNSNVTVSLASFPSGAVLGGTATMAASNGVASFSNLTLNKASTSYSLSTSSGTLSLATTNTIIVTPGTATQLVITTQPPARITAGVGFGLVVAAEDSFGNIDPTFAGTVTAALLANPGNTTLGGNLTATASSGVASFSNLTLNKVAAGYTIQVTSGTLTAGTSNGITVLAPQATRLVVTTQPPSGVTVNAGFGLVVMAEDAFGNVDPTFVNTVTLALSNNPTGATLGGILTATANLGVATFSGVSLNKVGTGYTLRLTGGNLTPATTSGINVIAGTATQLVITTQPPGSVAAGAGIPLVVKAEDGSGNVDGSFTGSVTLSLVVNPGSATLGGGFTVMASSGVATFSTDFLDKVASGYRLNVSSGSLGVATTSSIAVTPGTASQLVVTTQPPTSGTAGIGFGLVAMAEDPFGNVDPTFNGMVALALATNPGGATLSGTTPVTASAGVATFAGMTLDKVATGYSFTVSSSGLTPATTNTLDLGAGSATQLVVTTQPEQPDPTDPDSDEEDLPDIVVGFGFGLVVSAEDQFGNLDTNYVGSVSLALDGNPGGATLGGPINASVQAGKARFSALTLNKAGTGYTIKASSASLQTGDTTPLTIVGGPATQLVITIQPPSSVTAGAGFGLTVLAEDAFGNIDPSFNSSVTVALGHNPAGDTLGGTLSVTASMGTAAFSSLTLDKAGTGATLNVSTSGLSTVPTNSFNVNPGTATQLVVTTEPPGNVTAGVGFSMIVTAEDAFGNVDPTFKSGVSVALLNNPAGDTLGGTALVSATGGVARFNGLTLTRATSGDSLQATFGALTPAPTNSFTVNAASATKLVIATQPPASVTAGAAFGLSIAAEDPFGNVDPGFGGDVSLARLNNPTGATLGGSTLVAADSGVATFSNLTLNKTGTGYTLQATGVGVTAVTTSSINVNPGTATQLVVTTQPPASSTAGVGFGLTVMAEDALGNVDPTFGGTVALALATNPNGATLGGTKSATASSGQASFSGLTLDKAGSGATLQASSGTLSMGTSNSITITAASATQLVVSTQPPASVTAGAAFGLTVSAEDGFGNVDGNYNGSLIMSLATSPAGTTLGGGTSATISAGQATLSSLTLNKAGSGVTLHASASGLPQATTSSITVSAAPATRLVITAQPPASVTAGAAFGLTVSAEDSFGNVDPSFNMSVSAALASNPAGDTVGGTTSAMAASGVATFSALSLNKATAGDTLKLTGGNLTSAPTSSITVNPGTAVKLVVTAAPSTSVTAGNSFGLTVSAEDSLGNVDPTFTGTVALALLPNPNGATLSGTSSLPASSGVATFTGLSLDKAGSGATLQASSGTLAQATTSAPTVTPASATQLVVTAQPPTGVTAGTGFGLKVAAEDRFGNIDTNFAGNVALTTSPAGATLGGTATVAVAAGTGVATFSGLTLDQTAPGDTLKASSGSLAPATTGSIAVTAAPATKLVITTQPPASVTAGVGFGLTVSAEDSFGNVDLSYHGTVTLALANGSGGAPLGGPVSLAASSGVATFAGLLLDTAATSDTLQATSSDHLAPATTTALRVTAAPAAKLLVTMEPPASVTAGAGFGLAVTAEDDFGNVDTNFNGSVALALDTNPAGDTLGGSTSVTASAGVGVATFSGLTLDKVTTGATLQVSSSGLASATTSSLTVSFGPPARLVITTQPPASATAGTGFGLTVSAEDSFGNVDTSYQGSIALALDQNPAGDTLAGNAPVTASAGVATFSGLMLTKTATGDTLKATSSGLAGTTSSPFNVAAAPATQLVVTTEPAAHATAGIGFGLAVSAEDSFGNVDTSYQGSVALALDQNPAGDTLGGTTSVAVSSGVATFSGLMLTKTATGDTLKATSGTLAGTSTSSVNVVAAPASQLAVTSPPPGSVTAGAPFGLTVSAEDSFGNIDKTFAGSIALALANNPAGATLHGQATLTASSGVATFANLTLDNAASGATLKATSTSVTSTTSGAIAVTAAPATQLVVTTQPNSSVTAGLGFGLAVSAEDSFGNVDPSFTSAVTLALANAPTGENLGGTPTVAASAGVATFSGLTLSKAATGDTLRATSTHLAGAAATTSSFTVAAAPATQLVLTTPPPGNVTAGDGFGLVVTAEDGFGNLDPSFNGNVVATLANNPSGATLGGDSTETASAGIATFTNLKLDKAGASETLQLASGSLAKATTNDLTVAAAPATKLVITTGPPPTVTAGVGFAIAVKAEDAFGNVDPTFHGAVTAALVNNPASDTLQGGTTGTASSGSVTLSGLTLDRAATGATLKVSATGLSDATTSSLTVSAAPASQLVIMSQPPSSVIAGAGFGLTVQAEDSFGNVDTSFGGNVVATLASNPNSATLGGSSTVAASAGLATFSGLTLDRAGAGASLKLGSGSLTTATTSPITVNAAPATQLVVMTQPPANVTIGSGFNLVVAAEDQFQNVAPSFNGSVALALTSNPGGAALGGTPSVTASAGVARLSGLVLNKIGSGYVLQASGGGLSPVSTSAITVNPAPATQLVIATPPPGSVNAGAGFGLVVEALDGFGDVDPSFSGSVSVALASNPGGGSLGGPQSVTASGGVATFSGLTLSAAANGATLQINSGNLAPATTGGIAVIPPPTTVQGVAPEKVSAGKRKPATTLITIQFNEAVNASQAQNPASYTLSTVAQGKKHPSKPLAIAQVSYNPATHIATLTPAKKLVLSPPVQIQINSSNLTDAFGRPLDGNHDGQPGGNFQAIVSNSGVTVSSVRASAIASASVRAASLSPHTVDALFEAGFSVHGRHRHRRP